MKNKFTKGLAMTLTVSLLAVSLSVMAGCGKGSAYKDIKGPVTENEVSTWDCIWFGNYWQNTDSNGDGKVTEDDNREPLKWRVLEIDADGNAFLISDKLLDIIAFNPDEIEVTWEDCTLRSFLNNYGASANASGIDYSASGFMKNAFTDEEINAITVSTVVTEDNPVFGTAGGNDTQDKIFCLSFEEAVNPAYGFVKNELNGPEDGEKFIFTEEDPTRVAVSTAYEDGKEGFPGKSNMSPAAWWLRSPANSAQYPDHVSGGGGAYVASLHMDKYRMCIRPVLRMNLKDASKLWKYAGTVCSDGTVNER
ncbi:MAG: DUF6273 domain-containing protein [Lachnospiraceae bacterium]|nr:DUF6273 domain-containing protein [Lachnospiraceae bacterium]